MTRCLPLVVVLFCLVLTGGARAADGPQTGPAALNPGPTLDSTLAVGDIVVSYPRGLESQARRAAEVCQTVVVPRLGKLRTMERAFSDPQRIAKALTRDLGCEVSERDMAAMVTAMGRVAAFVQPMFTEVRIYREADLKSSGGVNNGAVSLTYNPATDKFQFGIEFWTLTPDEGASKPPEARPFLPVVVKADGSFRAEKGLASLMGDMLDGVSRLALQMQFGALRATASVLLVLECGTDPFVWWFIDGASQWTTLRIVQDVAPEYAQQCREMLLPEAPTPSARARVNLPAWPASEDPTPRDARDKESSYCAHELLDRLLRDRPDGALAAVLGRLKNQKPVDTQVILRALDAVLGSDSRAMLLEYVPEEVQTGLQEGRPARLREEGYQAFRDGDVLRALKPLSDALAMSPSDPNMRVNLAIAMRREGHFPKWASERQIRLVAAVAQGQGTEGFALQGTADDETCYVLGRTEQLRGRTKEAKALLLRLAVTHVDAQAALAEIAEDGGPPTSRPAEQTGQGGPR